MNNIIWIVGAIVIVAAILGFFGKASASKKRRQVDQAAVIAGVYPELLS